jgi:hypothetical protein
MNSMAQQAVPKGSGHRLFLRAHASIASIRVVSSAELPSGCRIAPPYGDSAMAFASRIIRGPEDHGTVSSENSEWVINIAFRGFA